MGRIARLKRARDKDVLPIVRFFELQIFELHLPRIRGVWCSLLSEDGMLTQCESGGLRQIDADIIVSASIGISSSPLRVGIDGNSTSTASAILKSLHSFIVMKNPPDHWREEIWQRGHEFREMHLVVTC